MDTPETDKFFATFADGEAEPLQSLPTPTSDSPQMGDSCPPSCSRCIVHGCVNHRYQGRFIGDLCAPCHEYITTGRIGDWQNKTIYILTRERDEARGQANDMREKWLAKGLCCEHLGAELHEAINQRDEARGQRDRLAWLLGQIYHDLPQKRDWFNPDYEKEIKTLQSLTPNQP